MEEELKTLIRRAEDEELGAGMRPEAITALIQAVKTVAPGFASLPECLMGGVVYEEAEKHYFDTDDEFPLKYISAMKSIAITFQEEDDTPAPATEPEEEDAARGTSQKILGSSPRQRMIETEVDDYCKRAGEEQLDKDMRDEGIKAIKIAANKFAYKKKYYDSANDKMIVFPSVAACLGGYDVYEEAEKHYYDPEDDYPLKYTAALRDLSLQAGGADEDVEHMETMGMGCDSDDEFFGPTETEEDAARGTSQKILGSSPRQRMIETEVDEYCKRAGEEQLDKDMRDEGIKAIKIAANKFAYKKKYYDSANDKMIVFPSVAACLLGYDVYEEAEKHYYDPEDDYPLKYTAALRDLSLQAGGADEDVEHMETMGMGCDSDDEFFGPTEKDVSQDVAASTKPPVLGSSPRQRLIEAELDIFCKRAGEEQLDKEMREEGIIAVKIAANKFAYKKKYYDSGNDKLIVFPAVASCLVGYDVYEEAEKHYYDPGDDYPLKYIAALRDLSLEAGGADEDVEHMETMAMDCESDDEFFG